MREKWEKCLNWGFKVETLTNPPTHPWESAMLQRSKNDVPSNLSLFVFSLFGMTVVTGAVLLLYPLVH